MIRKSSKSRRALLEALGAAVPEFQDATDAVDEAAAEVLGVNRTDLRCLGLLLRRGPTHPGELARAIWLTPGAMTTVLDRLERKGFVRRAPDSADRRGVRVEVTDRLRGPVEAIWGPLRDEGGRRLAAYATRELEFLLEFLRYGRDLQQAHAARIRGLGLPGGRGAAGRAGRRKAG